MEDKNLTGGCFRKKVLTIAGSDCSGGGGRQTDFKKKISPAVCRSRGFNRIKL